MAWCTWPGLYRHCTCSSPHVQAFPPSRYRGDWGCWSPIWPPKGSSHRLEAGLRNSGASRHPGPSKNPVSCCGVRACHNSLSPFPSARMSSNRPSLHPLQTFWEPPETPRSSGLCPVHLTVTAVCHRSLYCCPVKRGIPRGALGLGLCLPGCHMLPLEHFSGKGRALEEHLTSSKEAPPHL